MDNSSFRLTLMIFAGFITTLFSRLYLKARKRSKNESSEIHSNKQATPETPQSIQIISESANHNQINPRLHAKNQLMPKNSFQKISLLVILGEVVLEFIKQRNHKIRAKQANSFSEENTIKQVAIEKDRSSANDETNILHYIDKVHSTLTENVNTTNRVGLFLLSFCIIVIALSVGLVSTDQGFSFSGLNFVISFWILLTGGAWIVGVLYIYFLGLTLHGYLLQDLIVKLYKDVGFNERGLQDNSLDTLTMPYLLSFLGESMLYMSSKFDKIFIWFVRILNLLIIFLIPIGTEFCAFYKVVVLHGLFWWILLPFILLFLLTIICTVLFTRSIIKSGDAERVQFT